MTLAVSHAPNHTSAWGSVTNPHNLNRPKLHHVARPFFLALRAGIRLMRHTLPLHHDAAHLRPGSHKAVRVRFGFRLARAQARKAILAHGLLCISRRLPHGIRTTLVLDATNATVAPHS